MDRTEFENLGNQLRDLGHRRRQLAEQIFTEMQEQDISSSEQLYRQLSSISEQAISLMTRQKELFDRELQKLQ